MAREFCEDKSRNIVSSSTGFVYSDDSSTNPAIHTHLVNQIQGFDSSPEIFNLTTGMEMIGFSKNLHHHHQPSDGTSAAHLWRTFFNKAANNASTSSKPTTMNESTSDFYQQEFNKQADFTTGMSDTSSENLLVGHESAAWQENRQLIVDDSSLRQTDQSNHDQGDDIRFMGSSSRDGFFNKSANIQHQQQLVHHQGHFQLRNSKYLGPAQELLNEFCSLASKQTDASKTKIHRAKLWDDEGSSTSSRKQALHSLEFVELQKRKTKLLSMLEEVDRRYRNYCDQMKAVVSSFEAVAGIGAAAVYSALASKAMSKHFRCLRDGIIDQIQATRKAMGEKDPVAPGTTRGETPRLRLLDQAFRQQRAYQQMSMMESHPWRPQRGLPERSVSVLRAWLFEHFLHPYPSDVDKHILARQTGLSRSQVSNWFINARVRLWKPMVEEMYWEETKEQDDNINNKASSDDVDDDNGRPNQNLIHTDEKPTPDQLLRIDSECLSSIINNPEKNHPAAAAKTNKTILHHQTGFGPYAAAMELDFSSYNHHNPEAAVSYDSTNHNFNGGGGGVSLTLGLQQHGGSGGVSLAFSPASQTSLFYATRDHMEDCQQVQYSLLGGDQGQNLPYRNLMGAQLLHDLAG